MNTKLANAFVAVDIGGTFTDIVLFSGDQVFTQKTLTTSENLIEGLWRGTAEALTRAGCNASDISAFMHATTIVTNALIERKGGPIAMVFTTGFPDILEIRDCRRYDIYDLQIELPKPLVERDAVFTVDERILSDGSIEMALAPSEIERLCEKLKRANVRAVGICLMNAYRNDQHERLLADRIAASLPDLYISRSSEIAPQIREYWRASTTSVNAYAMPVVGPYLAELESTLRTKSVPAKPLIMLSSGGVVGPSTASRVPARMIESGPAAGALGAAYAARILGLDRLLAFDMGGTTAKICLIQDQAPMVTGRFEIDRVYRMKEGSGLPVIVPTTDLIEIGAGGGSIAHIDRLGLLKVGPESAGSNPGPAAYGLGGSEATVTDADLVLGLINPDAFLGGKMRLDPNAAKAALANLGRSLEMSVVGAARGVFEVTCEAMASAVRAHAAERGVDCRGTPILAFGGAGPVHACAVAELLDSTTVLFPPLASVYSAFGTLVSPRRLDLVRSAVCRLDEVDFDDVEALFVNMEEEGRSALIESGVRQADISYRYSADMRYRRQQYEIPVEFGDRPSIAGGAGELRARFEDEYLRRYRLVQAKAPVEVVNWRVSAIGPALATAPDLARMEVTPRPPSQRTVHLWDSVESVRTLPRDSILPTQEEKGPLIIEEALTTVVIPPDWSVRLGEFGCLVATRTPKDNQQ